MSKKLNPAYEIRKLKKEVKDLRLLCNIAGVPLLFCYMPEAILNTQKVTVNPEKLKWVKQKTKEYNKLFPKKKRRD